MLEILFKPDKGRTRVLSYKEESAEQERKQTIERFKSTFELTIASADEADVQKSVSSVMPILFAALKLEQAEGIINFFR